MTQNVLVSDDTFVPKDATEMVEVYGPYVRRLVQKYNQVSTNFEDLLQHTWTKLVEVDVLTKYQNSVGHQARQITGDQAAKYLKMSWNQFKVFMWRAHVGDKVATQKCGAKLTQKVLDRDQGICRDPIHGDSGWDALAFAQSLQALEQARPDAYQETRRTLREKVGIDEGISCFWSVSDVGGKGRKLSRYNTQCLFCAARKSSSLSKEPLRSKSALLLTPVTGTRGSKTALYNVLDVEKVRIQREESKRCKEQPGYEAFQIPSTKSRFKLYLARSVHNIYANWCRTRKRRYQELYQAPTETGQAWESFLEDDGRNNPEAKVIVTQEVNANVDRLMLKVQRKVRDGQISRGMVEARLSQGHTLVEILREFDLPREVLKTVTAGYG